LHKGLKEPHLFNAASNPLKIIKNLAGILAEVELDKIRREIDVNVVALYKLGESHFLFAKAISNTEWRQKISRLYYGAYNVRRAVSLKFDGTYSTDSSDHQKIDSIPDTFNNYAVYRNKLKSLRDDRNLADYNHLAKIEDLLLSVEESERLVTDLFSDAKNYFTSSGINL